MLAYTLKNVVELVPSAYEHVKKASIDQDLPLDSRDSVIASALSLQYQQHVRGKPVDMDAFEKVAAAVSAYQADDIVDDLTAAMVHNHTSQSLAGLSNPTDNFHVKAASFEGDLAGFKDIEALSQEAQELYKEAQELGVEASEAVRRYSGHAFLSKRAAVEALAARYHLSGQVGFAKIAAALGRLDTDSLPHKSVQDVCQTITAMDKEAGLNARGFDFYREALLVKQAEVMSAIRVKVAGTSVPYETIARVGKDRISQYLGEDIAREMDQGPAYFKQVAETLPLDLQRVLLDLTKNV